MTMTRYHWHRRDHRDMIPLKHSLPLGAFVMSVHTVAKVWGQAPDLPPPQKRNNAVGSAPFSEHP